MKLNPNKDESSSHPLVFATKYCDQIGEIRSIINKLWERIQKIPNLKDTFPDKPQIAYKSNQCLRNQLVRAKLPALQNTEPSSTPNMDSAPVPPKETQEPQVPTTSLDLPRATRSNSNVPFYSGKQPPTFAQQRVFPFTAFKQAKAIKPCFKAKCKTCGKLTHNSNFVKSKVNQRCYPVRPCSKPMTCQSAVIFAVTWFTNKMTDTEVYSSDESGSVTGRAATASRPGSLTPSPAPSTASIGRPRKSPVWDYFVFNKGTEKSICQVEVPLTADELGAEATVTRTKVCGHAIAGEYPTNLKQESAFGGIQGCRQEGGRKYG